MKTKQRVAGFIAAGVIAAGIATGAVLHTHSGPAPVADTPACLAWSTAGSDYDQQVIIAARAAGPVRDLMNKAVAALRADYTGNNIDTVVALQDQVRARCADIGVNY